MKTVNIKGKDYVEVKERIAHLAANKDYSIETEYKFFENTKMWVVKATLTIYSDGKERKYNGTAQEIIGDGYINKTSALENCETSAVGRACAMAGVGIIQSIASADEVVKAQSKAMNGVGISQSIASADEVVKAQSKAMNGKKWLNDNTPLFDKVLKKIESGDVTSIELLRIYYKMNKHVENKISMMLKNKSINKQS